MSDLTERLRMIGAAPNLLGAHVKTCTEAADEIDRLNRELAVARAEAVGALEAWQRSHHLMISTKMCKVWGKSAR